MKLRTQKISVPREYDGVTITSRIGSALSPNHVKPGESAEHAVQVINIGPEPIVVTLASELSVGPLTYYDAAGVSQGKVWTPAISNVADADRDQDGQLIRHDQTGCTPSATHSAAVRLSLEFARPNATAFETTEIHRVSCH